MSDSLMISVSGVRGLVGTDLTPELVARFAAAFGRLVGDARSAAVVVGRDARVSGPMFASAVHAGLQSVGCSVIDCGMVPTPTLQLAVEHHHAAGGIAITASHNPAEWNALKFIGPDGLFLEATRAGLLVDRVQGGDVPRAPWDGIGGVTPDHAAVRRHLDAVLGLQVIDRERIRRRGFTVGLDCVRGAGGTIMPELLEALGCRVVGIDLEPDGRFPRPPEPLPENLRLLGDLVRHHGADVGMAVDPDVDRLALVDETGTPIGEDYTLALAVRAVLGGEAPATPTGSRASPVVCNLSTSLVVEDAARDCGARVQRAPVGEANVARAMREARAVVGGEGNGGVILPQVHLGRDAPIAAALVLELLARGGGSLSAMLAAWPRYVIVKARAPRGSDLSVAYAALREEFPDAGADEQDGLRLAWPGRWLHVRPSGTEPIVRLIAEADTRDAAAQLIEAGRRAMERKGRKHVRHRRVRR